MSFVDDAVKQRLNNIFYKCLPIIVIENDEAAKNYSLQHSYLIIYILVSRVYYEQVDVAPRHED